jgi:hypothetical protein
MQSDRRYLPDGSCRGADAIDLGHRRDRNSRSAAVFGRVLSFGLGPKENRKRFASGYSTTRSGYLAGPLITADKSDNIRTSSWYLSAERGSRGGVVLPMSGRIRSIRLAHYCTRARAQLSSNLAPGAPLAPIDLCWRCKSSIWPPSGHIHQ